MKQVLQHLRTGQIELAEVPCPAAPPGHLLVQSTRSLISAGTERMLVEFGQASLLAKARSQPEKVRQVLNKIKTDGLLPTLETVFSRLDEPLPLPPEPPDPPLACPPEPLDPEPDPLPLADDPLELPEPELPEPPEPPEPPESPPATLPPPSVPLPSSPPLPPPSRSGGGSWLLVMSSYTSHGSWKVPSAVATKAAAATTDTATRRPRIQRRLSKGRFTVASSRGSS